MQPLRHNIVVRKLVVGVSATLVTALLAAVAVDFGTTIFAEYRLSRTVRTAAHLHWDPSVAILGFPFIVQAVRQHYKEVEIKATDVEQPMVGKAGLEATMHSIDLADATWLFRPDAKLPMAELESRIIIDSSHLGRYFGIKDLMVEAPSRETNDPTGGTTESGISDSHGLVFTGTPKSAGFNKRVSVSVDLTVSGPDRSTLVFTPTGILTGPGTARQDVPADKKDAVLAAFRTSLPDQRLPFGLAPTSQGARGSDIIIEGIALGVTVTLEGFRQS